MVLKLASGSPTMLQDEFERFERQRIAGEIDCARCDSTGWVELFSGGTWVGRDVAVQLVPCDCPCGDAVRATVPQWPAEITVPLRTLPRRG